MLRARILIFAALLIAVAATAATFAYVQKPAMLTYSDDLVTHEFPRPYHPPAYPPPEIKPYVKPYVDPPSAFGCDDRTDEKRDTPIDNDWVNDSDAFLCLSFPRPQTWRVASELYISEGSPGARTFFMPVPDSMDAPVGDIYPIVDETMLQFMTGRTRTEVVRDAKKITTPGKNTVYELPADEKPYSSDGKYRQKFVIDEKKFGRTYLLVVFHYPKEWGVPDPMPSLMRIVEEATGY